MENSDVRRGTPGCGALVLDMSAADSMAALCERTNPAPQPITDHSHV